MERTRRRDVSTEVFGKSYTSRLMGQQYLYFVQYRGLEVFEDTHHNRGEEIVRIQGFKLLEFSGTYVIIASAHALQVWSP